MNENARLNKLRLIVLTLCLLMMVEFQNVGGWLTFDCY